MVHPTLDEVRELAKHGNLIPIWTEVPADLETPASVYLKLRNERPSFLLESVERGEQVGRYSFLGIDPIATLTAQDGHVTLRKSESGEESTLANGDPLVAMKDVLDHYRPVALPGIPEFHGGLVGYLGYDAVRFFERAPLPERQGLGLPDAVFLLADTVAAFDHVKRQLRVIANIHLDGAAAIEAAYQHGVERIASIVETLNRPLAASDAQVDGADETGWHSNVERSAYEEAVQASKQLIRDGDIFQVVLSQRLSHHTEVDPFAVYRALRMLNPSPYMYFLDLPDDLQIIGSSPETMVRLQGRTAEVRPIAGTRPRGTDPEEDRALAEELLADPKERAEHVMLVDLGRNDLGRVCRYGTVEVPELMQIERYSHVMHIVSSVRGELEPDQDAFDLLRATFPAGTVSGAPKVRAMEIIADLEGERRGPYAGAVGYFGYSGEMDTCITIRTLVMHDGQIHVQAGAGIVADSDPAREFEETLSKARALAVAVEQTEDAAATKDAVAAPKGGPR
jgi:anthranilate synthase component 1